jgi:hypothetical protein
MFANPTIIYTLLKANGMCSRAKKVCAVARKSMCSRAKEYVQSREKVCAVARRNMCSRAKKYVQSREARRQQADYYQWLRGIF